MIYKKYLLILFIAIVSGQYSKKERYVKTQENFDIKNDFNERPIYFPSYYEDVLHIPLPKNEVTINEHFDDFNFSRNYIDVKTQILEVLYGRETFIDPEKHLNINVKPHHRCYVRVVDQYESEVRAGMLLPTYFDCKFRKKSIIYRHLGSRHPSFDDVKMIIKYETSINTYIIPTALQIKVIYDTQLAIVTKNRPLKVNNLHFSNAISTENTMFIYDENVVECYVTILSYLYYLPKDGVVTSTEVDIGRNPKLKCEEFLSKQIKYQYLNWNSTKTDSIPLKVELFDKTNQSLQKREFFHKVVLIPEGKVNTSPSLVSHSTLRMEVNHPGLTALTATALQIKDLETPLDQIMIILIDKLEPHLQGMLVSTDNQNSPLLSFYQGDINDYKIAYKPPDSYRTVTKEKHLKITMQALDTEGLSSDVFDLTINLKPIDPSVTPNFSNAGLQLFEGRSGVINASKHLNDFDKQDNSGARFQVIGGLMDGELLVNQTPTDTFNKSDLANGLVTYYHDGENSASDNLLLKLRDQNEIYEFLFPITVFPIDKEAPILQINKKLFVVTEHPKNIPDFILKARDSDSDDSMIYYEVHYPFPKYGYFAFRQKTTPRNPLLYNYIDGFYEMETRVWTQQDIIDGRLFYTVRNYDKFSNVSDAAYLVLNDELGFPNYSNKYKFKINIIPDIEKVPSLYSNTNYTLPLKEQETSVISKDILYFSGKNARPEDIIYTFEVDPNKGTFTHIDMPSQIIESFTQQNINNDEIMFKSSNIEVGKSAKKLELQFNVSNNINGDTKSDIFQIFLKPVNNRPPIVSISEVIISNHEDEITFNRDIISISDVDTEEDKIIFRIVSVPKHGNIFYNSNKLVPGSQFTIKDMESGYIKYKSDQKNQGIGDHFLLEVDDRVHTVEVPFEIIPEIEKYIESLAHEFIEDPPILHVNEGEEVAITTDIWSINQAHENNIVFIIEESPKYGRILENGNLIIKFSWNDLLQEIIHYSHNADEIGLDPVTDNFTLIITDMNSKLASHETDLNRITVTVRIIPSDNTAPVVEVIQPITVLEGDKMNIMPDNIAIFDVDTPEHKVVCVITSMPQYGSISLASGLDSVPTISFLQSDLFEGLVVYNQNLHRSFEPKSDMLKFFCSDGLQDSEELSLTIFIEPQNDEKPIVISTTLYVEEGFSSIIDESHLKVSDLDEPMDEIRFYLNSFPIYGKLLFENHTEIQNYFTKADLLNNKIVYKHDGSESSRDVIEIEVTDGKANHSRMTKLKINILSIDDEFPEIDNLKEITLESKESTIISKNALHAFDLDSEDSMIQYHIKELPMFGTLQLLDISSMLPVKNFSVEDIFTQKDINTGLIQYQNTYFKAKNDSFLFKLTDGFNFPEKNGFVFKFNLLPFDVVPPSVESKGVSIDKGGWVYLSPSILNISDDVTHKHELNITLTKLPIHGDLKHINYPAKELKYFSQADIENSKVIYIHNPESIATEDSFEFIVSDGFNEINNTFTFKIFGNNRPVLFLSEIYVWEGQSKILSKSKLRIEDLDTHAKNLTYEVVNAPQFGALLLDHKKSIKNFTQQQIDDERVSYRHDGQSTKSEDKFSVTVSDGTSSEFYVVSKQIKNVLVSEPQFIPIKVRPVTNSTHNLTINDGTVEIESQSASSHLDDSRKGIKAKLVFKITKRNLYVNNSNASSIIYIIDTPPRFGYVCHLQDMDRKIANFSQHDVNQDSIRFVLNGDTRDTFDTFTFRIMDEDRNIWPSRKFHLEWSVVSLEKDFYLANEGQDLEIFLVRKGSLKSPTTVDIKILNSTGHQQQMGRPKGHSKRQVQFMKGQTKSKYLIKLPDDSSFEGPEVLYVKLGEQATSVIGNPKTALVTVHDQEDESEVQFSVKEFRAAENVKKIEIPLTREGDLSKYLDVFCITKPGSANGTQFGKVESFTDFISRKKDATSIIRFKPGESRASCFVQLIDDTLVEEDETFQVLLSSPTGGRLGSQSVLSVIIQNDYNDYPRIYFGKSEHFVEGDSSKFEINLFRTGSDLNIASTVRVISEPLIRNRATKGVSSLNKRVNTISIDRVVNFPSNSKSQSIEITLKDKKGTFSKVRHQRNFRLKLIHPSMAKIEDRGETVIFVKEKPKEVTVFEITEQEIRVKEQDLKLRIPLKRTGNLNQKASVRCCTRSDSAIEKIHFRPRQDSDESSIVFNKGVGESVCQIELIDNNEYEKIKEFFVYLSYPDADLGEATVGSRSRIKVIVEDYDDDSPKLRFEKARIKVIEPSEEGSRIAVKLKILRSGDISDGVLVRVFTRDSSAKSVEDYEEFRKDFYINPKQSEVELSVFILGDRIEEFRETFNLNLQLIRSSSNHPIKIESSQLVVLIQDPPPRRKLILPEKSLIVALSDYKHDFISNQTTFMAYEAIVCVMVCDPKHPMYSKSKKFCNQKRISEHSVKYAWRISPSNTANAKWRKVLSSYFSSGKVLENIFVAPNSEIECSVILKTANSKEGIEFFSHKISVLDNTETCLRRNNTEDSYVARIKYLDEKDVGHPNTVVIEVLVPHAPGMVPFISTNKISDIQKLLSINAQRISAHKCSNLVDISEQQVEHGFFSSRINILSGNKRDKIFDSSSRFFNHLHEESCLWRWKGYFNLFELTSVCGGSEIADKGHFIHNSLSFTLPLFVSLAKFSPEYGWKEVHESSRLKLNLSYDQSLFTVQGYQTYKNGRGSNQNLSATLHIDGIEAEEQDRFISFQFSTNPNFNGIFVLNSDNFKVKSVVTSLDNPDAKIKFEKLPGYFGEKIQNWKFTSSLLVSDYGGSFLISLTPCLYHDQKKNWKECEPQDNVFFRVQLKLGQSMNPVAERFSLNTRLHISKNEKFFSNISAMTTKNEAVFSPGDRIFGGVYVDPIESLGDGFQISIEKCFVCTGVDGYVPKFDPENGELGCIEDTKNVSSFKIIDQSDPSNIDYSFKDIPFEAHLLTSRKKKRSIRGKIDGFSFNGAPLFQAAHSNHWFVHVIFIIKKAATSQKMFKRHAYVIANSRKGKSILDDDHPGRTEVTNTIEDIGTRGRGTNMHDFYLNTSMTDSQFTLIDWSFLHKFLIIFLVVSSVIVFTTVITYVVYTKRKTSPKSTIYSTLPLRELKTRNNAENATESTFSKDTPKVLSFYSSNEDISSI